MPKSQCHVFLFSNFIPLPQFVPVNMDWLRKKAQGIRQRRAYFSISDTKNSEPRRRRTFKWSTLSLCQNTHFRGRPHKVVVVFQRVWGQVITRSTLRWYFHLSLRSLQAEHEPQDIDWTTNSPWDDYKGRFTLHHQQQQTLHRVLLNQRVNPVSVWCRWSLNEHSIAVCQVRGLELQQWKSSLKWWASNKTFS